MSVGPDLPVVMSSSGKGGVGKSLQSIGITAAIAREIPVGLLDIDVRSPNLPYILGLPGRVETTDEGRPIPNYARLGGRDVPVFSSSFIFGSGTSITMPGEQVRSTIKDMVYDVLWPEIDALVIDVDPGPGDSLAAVSRVFRHTSAYIISTSDPSSLEDCARMIDACRNSGTVVLGVVANMAGTECPHCSARLVCADCGADVPYGDPTPVVELARRSDVRYMGSLPWNPLFRTEPVRMVEGRHRAIFDDMARQFLTWNSFWES